MDGPAARAEADSDRERAADLALRLALIYARTFGFPGEAVPLLERSLALRPSDRFALRHLVELTRQLGDWARHRAALERSLALARTRSERSGLLLALADVEFDRLRRPEAARVHLDHLLLERPRDAEALARLARVLRVLGDSPALAAAMRRLAALATTVEERQRHLLDLAELQLDTLDRVAEAEATLEQAQEGPDVRRLTWLRGRVVPETGRPAEESIGNQPGGWPREASPQEAPVEIEPDERVALREQFTDLSHFVAPRGMSRRVPVDESESPWFAAARAADAGRMEQAAALLHHALERDPADRAAWELLAAILAEAGDRDGEAAAHAALRAIEEQAAPTAAAGRATPRGVRALAPAPAPTPVAAHPSPQPPARLAAAAAAAAAHRPAAAGQTPDSAAWEQLEARVAAALSALAAGDGEAARGAASEALRIDPDSADAWEALAAACGSLGDAVGRAHALAERAERAWSADEAATFNRQAGEALSLAGDDERADLFFRRYLRWAPLDEEVFLRLSDAARGAARHEDLRLLLDERVEALERLRLESGDDSLGVALSLARTELAALMEEVVGDTAAAARQLEQARRDWPHNDEALERLAALLEDDQEWTRLADVLEALVGVTEDRGLRGERLKRLVGLYRGPLGDPVAARETLRIVLRELPPDEAADLRRALEGED